MCHTHTDTWVFKCFFRECQKNVKRSNEKWIYLHLRLELNQNLANKSHQFTFMSCEFEILREEKFAAGQRVVDAKWVLCRPLTGTMVICLMVKYLSINKWLAQENMKEIVSLLSGRSFSLAKVYPLGCWFRSYASPMNANLEPLLRLPSSNPTAEDGHIKHAKQWLSMEAKWRARLIIISPRLLGHWSE